MRTVAVLVIAGCSQPTRAPAKPDLRRTVTPLQVILLDDFAMENACDGIAPRKFHVSLDGVVRGTAVVPCRTVPVSPPKQFALPVFDVAPGAHVVKVVEPETEMTHELKLSFPVFDPPLGEADDDGHRELATKLPVWANETELQIHAPRTQLGF